MKRALKFKLWAFARAAAHRKCWSEYYSVRRNIGELAIKEARQIGWEWPIMEAVIALRDIDSPRDKERRSHIRELKERFLSGDDEVGSGDVEVGKELLREWEKDVWPEGVLGFTMDGKVVEL